MVTMALSNVCMFYCCFHIVVFSMFLLTESFSVDMGLTKGFQHYADVFYTGTIVSLHCFVYDVDVNYLNITILVNDVLIFESKEQSKRINGMIVSFNSNLNDTFVRLQMTNLTLQHSGEYTCRVESDGSVEEDSFCLYVVSDSPECITKCDKTEEILYQHICYSQLLQNGEYFTWEKLNQDGSYAQLVHDFTATNLATKTVSTLNNMNINTTTPEIYKCSVWTYITPSVSLVERFCIFNLSCISESNTTDLQETGKGCTPDVNPTQHGGNSLQTAATLPSTLLNTSAHTFDGIHSNLPVILYIGIPCMIFSIIVILIVVCFVRKRNSQKYSDDSLTTTTGTEAQQAGYMTSTSFVNVALDQSKHQEKQSNHLTDGYGEYKDNDMTSQTHIYNKIEKDKNQNSPVGNYHEPRNITTGPYEITNLYSLEKETYDPQSHYSVPISTTKPDGGNVNDIAHKADNLNRTSGECDNIVYEPYDEPKALETPYAVLDPNGGDDTEEESD